MGKRVGPSSVGAAFPLVWLIAMLAAPLAPPLARPAEALLGDCGQPRTSGAMPSATDALEILKTAVGTSDCGGWDPCVCDVDSSGAVSATDALRTLQKAVGLFVNLVCPCVLTTTTTTTTTTLPPVLTTEIMTLVRLAGSYATADLAGTWEIHELESGPDGPWWGRGTITVASNGNFSGNVTGSDGFAENIAGRLVLSSGGVVTCTQNCNPTLNGALDSGKSVAVATDTLEDGTASMIALVRHAASYTQSNLAGTWGLHALTTGPAAPLWNRGMLTIAANGATTGTIRSSDGFTAPISLTLPLSGNGIVTCSGGDCLDAFRGGLDAGKTVVVATASDGFSAQLGFVCKRAASYSQADLVGTWRLNSIVSGQEQPWWSRGTLTIAANGALSGTITDIDGDSSPATGTVSIDSSGKVTISGDADFECAMDADKTVIACTDSW